MAEALLDIVGVTRSFAAGEQELMVLKDINLQIHHGEMIAIIGTSGSGKSTLMNILGCLDKPTKGRYFTIGKDTSTRGEVELPDYGRDHFGFIFNRNLRLGDLTGQGIACSY